MISMMRSFPASDAGEPAVLEHNIRFNVWHGTLSALALNAVNPFLGIYAIKMGATPFEVALLNALPALSTVIVLLPGAAWVERQREKKIATALAIFGHRVFFLALAAVPWAPPAWRAVAVVGIVGLMNLPGAVSNVAWQAFIASILPPDRRSRALARRSRYVNIAATAITLLAGRAIDLIGFPRGYQVIFAVGFLLSIAELSVFMRLVEAVGPADQPVPARPSWGHFMRGTPVFHRFVAASVLFYFSWQIPWPIFTQYQVRYLHANNSWMAALAVSSTIVAALSYDMWSRLAHRWTNAWALTLAVLGLATAPFFYMLRPGLLVLTLYNGFIGIISAGIDLQMLNTLLEVTPARDRATYLAYHGLAVAVTGVVSPMVGSFLYDLGGYGLTFGVDGVLRLVAVTVYGLFAFGQSGTTPVRRVVPTVGR